EIELAPFLEITSKGCEGALRRPFSHPPLIAAMAGLKRRIARGQIRPLRSGPKLPQDAVQHLAAAAPRPSAPACALGIAPISGSRTAHCASVRSLIAASLRRHLTPFMVNPFRLVQEPGSCAPVGLRELTFLAEHHHSSPGRRTLSTCG